MSKKSFGFGVVVECEGGIDEVDMRRILEDAFKDPTWNDVERFEVLPMGELPDFPIELTKK